MRGGRVLSLVLMALIAVGGCRTATRVKEFPRVDLEVEGAGNRGYLVGTPPTAGEVRATRQMLETDVEIPSFYKPKRSGQPVSLEDTAPSDAELGGQAVTGEPAGSSDTYVVQKGDSLWSIAAKPEIYGKATHWRRIFDANRDLLKSPDRVKVGMTLNIPRDGGGGSSTTYDDEGVSYKK